MSNPLKLKELVTIHGGAAAIVLSEGLNQKGLISSFVPTESSVAILKHIHNAVQYHGEQQERAINCFGVYGSGKSRLAVLIGQMLRDGVHSPEFESFLTRLKSINESVLASNLKSTFLASSDEDAKPYLIVPIYGRSGPTIQSDLVENLYRVVERTSGLNASEVLLKTEYSVAQLRLDEILELKPELAEVYLPGLGLGNEYHDPSSLRQGLIDHQSTALSVFSDWHKQLTFGTPFDAVNYGASLAKEIYLNATKQIQNNYRGIAIIWDEFGYALENMLDESQRSPIKEIFELQEFVETVCSPSNNHVLFIGLTHVSLSEYGHRANAGEDIKSRIETIQGRFTSLKVELKPAELEGYHLLAGQLQTSDLGLELKERNDGNAKRIYESCKDVPLFSRIEQELLRIIRNCYPLHPLTSAALLALSSRYAAATRTAFHFLSELSRNGYFEKEIDENNLYSAELIRLPALVNFYEEEINNDGHGDQFKNYKLACSQIKNIGEDPQNVVERENILAILMLSSLLDSNFQSSNEFLSNALHDNKFISSDSEVLRNALEWLVNAGLIWKNDTTSLWSIGGAGGTDFDTLIHDAVEKIPRIKFSQYLTTYPEITSELMPMLGEHSLDPSSKGIVRRFVVEPLSIKPVSRPKLNNYNVAKVYIVLGNSPSETSEIEHSILTFPKDEIYYWFCFEDLSKLESEFRLLLALIKLLEQSHSEEAKIRLRVKYESVRSNLLRILGEFYGRGGLDKHITKVVKQGDSSPIIVSSWNDFFLHVQGSILKLYDNELSVRASQKKRNVLGDHYHIDSAETEDIVQRVFNFDSNKSYQNDLLGYTETSESAAVVDGTLGASGFFIQRHNNSWDIKKIDELAVAERSIIELIRKEVLRIRPTPYRLTELAETLTRAPYGIPTAAIPIYIAVAIRGDISRIVWTTSSNNHARNLCKSIMDDKVGLRVQDFTQYQLNISEVLMSALKEIVFNQEFRIITEKHERARRSIELLRTHLESISTSTINSPKLNKGLRSIYETFQSIGRTNHELIEKVAEIIDPNKLITGSEPSFELKQTARDNLINILTSNIQVENQQKFDALKHIEALLPDLSNIDKLANYQDLFNGSGDLGDSIVEILQQKSNASTKYERILTKLIDSPVSTASELELGMGVGRLENLIENEKKYLATSKVNLEILASLESSILEIAKTKSIQVDELNEYLYALIKKLSLGSK